MTPPRSFDPAWLTDPTVFAVSRLRAHSDHRFFASREEAAEGVSSFELLLDGEWAYLHADAPDLVPEGLESEDADLDEWDAIPVPAHVQLHGYDAPQYANVQYPWDGLEDVRPPRPPMRYNPVSTYARDLDLAEGPAEGESIRLILEGAESACAVWVNGSFIGYATDSFTPSEFEVSHALRAGRNRLVVRVWKWSAHSWLEDQDFFRFSGLFRSVRLVRTPRAHIEDAHVETALADDLASARVELALRLCGPAADSARIEARLEGVGPLAPSGEGRWSIDLERPRLWSAEDPALYDLSIDLFDESGALLEHAPLKVGVRRFGIEDGLLRINGRRVVLKGVNRHEFGPEGRVVSRELIDSDLRLLKRLGVNAIRTSHYPNSSAFYELCDRYGFYVVDEMNLETHGTWDRILRGLDPIEAALPGDREEWLPALVDRAESMILRDRNHPSVVVWSLGNESFGGSVLEELSDRVRALDPRPVHYEGVHEDPRRPRTTDIASQMYTSAQGVRDYLRTHRDKPFILCEYAHAMGHSLGAVEDYLALMREEDLFQGAFVWDFADQALPTLDEAGRPRLGYGGDFSDAPHDADFCGDGVLLADRTLTAKALELAHLYRPIRTDASAEGLLVRNEHLFASTEGCSTRVVLAREGEVLAEGEIETRLGPGEEGRFPLPFEIPDEEGEYAITVEHRLREEREWAPAGHVVARDQGVVRVGDLRWTAPLRAAGPLELIDAPHNVGVRGEGFSLLFSRTQGGLQSYRVGDGRNGGRELLRGLPTPNFWHAPTANERGWGAPSEDGQWLLASRYARPVRGFDAFRATRLGDRVRVEWALALPTAPAGECSLAAEVHPDGTVEMSMRLDPGAGSVPPPEYGMLFAIDPRLERLEWYGEGPHDSAIDRRGSALLGLHRSSVSEQFVPYLRPQECGGHTGVRWMSIRDCEGYGIRFGADLPMEASALAWSPFEIENATHPGELPPRTRTWARAMLGRRGAGGDDSWGARTHPEFELPLGPLEFRFSFRGLAPCGSE